jgi:hypothetical protein
MNLPTCCDLSNSKQRHGDSYRRKPVAKKQKQTDTCLQCEGDAMLEVRRHASEAFTIMDKIHAAYCSNGKQVKTGTTIVQFAQALIEAEEDQCRLVAMLRRDAERRMNEVAVLIASLKFISDCTKETYSSGANLSSKSMTIPLTEIIRVAIHRLESIVTSDKGLLEGRQPHNEKNFINGLLE